MRPPIFTDIRSFRSVRAEGFQEAAFEETIGKSRYRWLRKLGNAKIGSSSGGTQITDASGVDDLLQVVSENAEDRRRVIFLCAYLHLDLCDRLLRKQTHGI